jgi:hypothetical protein
MRGWETKDVIVVTVALLSAAVNVSVPIMNHIFSVRKYGREKIWETKKELYGSVVQDAFTAAAKLHSAAMDSDTDQFAANCSEAESAIDHAEETYHSNYIVWSKEFGELLGTWLTECGFRFETMGEELNRYSDVVMAAHRKLLDVARKELQLP